MQKTNVRIHMVQSMKCQKTLDILPDKIKLKNILEPCLDRNDHFFYFFEYYDKFLV